MLYVYKAGTIWQALRDGRQYSSLTAVLDAARRMRLTTVRVIDTDTTHSYYVGGRL